MPTSLSYGKSGSTTTWLGQIQPRIISAATQRPWTCIVPTRDRPHVRLDERQALALGSCLNRLNPWPVRYPMLSPLSLA